MTPVTSATAFCSARRLLEIVDWRIVADCAGDTQTRISRRALRDATHPAGIVVAAKLLQATGDVLSVAQVGGRYAPTDLAALTGAGLATLEGLVGGRALWLLALRRNPAADPKKVPYATEVAEMFQALRKGEAVFGLDGPVESAGMEASELYSDDQLGGRVVSSAARFFGSQRGRY